LEASAVASSSFRDLLNQWIFSSDVIVVKVAVD